MTPEIKTQTYVIQAKIMVDTDAEINAVSLEEALEKSKELNIHDFITIDGNHNDSSLEINGLYKIGK